MPQTYSSQHIHEGSNPEGRRHQSPKWISPESAAILQLDFWVSPREIKLLINLLHLHPKDFFESEILIPDLSIRILAVSYAGAVEGSKAAFHLGRGCGHEKRTVLPSNGLSRERAEHPERAPNGFPGEAPPQNALEIFR